MNVTVVGGRRLGAGLQISNTIVLHVCFNVVSAWFAVIDKVLPSPHIGLLGNQIYNQKLLSENIACLVGYQIFYLQQKLIYFEAKQIV